MLVVFFTLQYGKVATYLYCKWQAEVVQKLKDCGCETHLADMFSQKIPVADSPAAIKGNAFEYQQEFSILIPAIPSNITVSFFADYNSSLIDGFVSPAFRPPSV